MSTLLVAVMLGCGTSLPDPEPREMSPSFGYYLQDTAVRITGSRFYPQIGVDASGRREPDIDAAFQVVLVGPDGGKGRYSLRGVTLSSTDQLAAIVPAGLPAGAYDLDVVGPTGGSGSISGAYTVTDTLAERIGVDSDAIVYTVHDPVFLRVALFDRHGERVLADAEVAISVEADDGEVGANLRVDSLDDGRMIDGVLVGKLGPDGEADVPLVVETPDLVTVTVSPTDSRSALAEGVIKLLFEPGDERETRIELPRTGFVAAAGAPFLVSLEVVDQFGNRVEQTETLVLRDKCRDFVSTPLSVTGLAAVQLTLERASTLVCPETSLLTIIGPEGESAPFTVEPGVTTALTVEVSASQVVAGEPIAAFVAPSDEFGNRSEWTGSPITVTDSVGGVAEGAFSCTTRVPFFCTAVPTRAAHDVYLKVRADDGIEGESTRFDVTAGAPAGIEVTVPRETAVAGEPMITTVGVYDAWDNLLDAEDYAASLLFADRSGPVTCVRDGVAASDEASFLCAPTVARADDRISVALPDFALAADSSAFDVVNGPMASVRITAPTTMTAGQSASFSFVALDAYGNAYLVGASATIDVTDSSDTLSFSTVGLVAGTASATGSITLAGSTRLVASFAGATLGTSAPVDVVADTADTLAVSALVPWAFVGDPVGLQVTALDIWGNRADLEGVATLGGGGDTGEATLVDGRGIGGMTPTVADTETIFTATSGLLSGAAPAMVIADRCPTGPTAAMTFGGASDAIACWDAGSGEAEIVASFAGSVAGGAPITTWQASVGSGQPIDAGGSTVPLVVGAPGVYAVYGIVVDAAGCGAEDEATAWVGADDGEAVGPIDVSIAANLAVGSGSTTVTLSGGDTCTGDPAAGASVFVRADRGGITGLLPSASGLVATLDTTGGATFTLDATSTDTGGAATVVAVGSALIAYGEGQTTFTGDNRRPRVAGQSPAGDTTDSVSEIVITFTEALLEDTVSTTAFSLSGPDAPNIDAATLDATGTAVTLWLATPIDASIASYAVTVSSAVRDEAGNRLDGGEVGAASSWTSGFGTVGSLGPVSACSPELPSFRPDGDDGPTTDADAVAFVLSSSSAPSRWAVTVTDSAGSVIRHQHPGAAAASDRWSWDGRDDSGAVVVNGTYTVEVYGEDTSGARGASCFATVDVDNLEVDDGG